jgi:hypothetical protein
MWSVFCHPFTEFFHFLPVTDGVGQYVRFASICLTSVQSFLEISVFVYNCVKKLNRHQCSKLLGLNFLCEIGGMWSFHVKVKIRGIDVITDWFPYSAARMRALLF